MPSKTYGAETARAKLPELLERAHHGMPTVITKRGKAYAILTPVHGHSGTRKGISILSLKGSGNGLWGADVAATVAGLRDEWA